MKRIKPISKFILAIFMISAGVMHFANPEFLLRIMPPYLPFHSELVMVSGVCEILLGTLLLVPQAPRLAAWGIHPGTIRYSLDHRSFKGTPTGQ
jgi:uncharacterized membrane protein